MIPLSHRHWEVNLFLPTDHLLTLKKFSPTIMPFQTEALGPGPTRNQDANFVPIFTLIAQSQDLTTPAILSQVYPPVHLPTLYIPSSVSNALPLSDKQAVPTQKNP